MPFLTKPEQAKACACRVIVLRRFAAMRSECVRIVQLPSNCRGMHGSLSQPECGDSLCHFARGLSQLWLW